MDLRVLGPIEVYNGHKLAVGGPRQRRILAALAMHAGEVVSVDRLADIAWSGEDVPERASHNVRIHVGRIREGLGDVAGRLATPTNQVSSGGVISTEVTPPSAMSSCPVM